MANGNEPQTWLKIIIALYILKILQRGPAHGLKIAEEIKERTQQVLSVNPNLLYPLLRAMTEKGYIQGEWESPTKRTKRTYAITSVGRRHIADLESRARQVLEAWEHKISILRQTLFND